MLIESKNVSKSYRQKQALKNISFTLTGPKIIGFLGHNGAGKTTFLNLLSGLISTTKGEIFINGQRLFNNSKILKDLCFVAETDNFQRELTIAQSLKASSFFYPKWDDELATDLIKRFALNKNDKIMNLSKGMVSALGIIVGFASNTSITIFDEPYIGLDVAARNLFYDLLIEQQLENPRLFILSTHLIAEASNLFDEVLIMQDGQLLVQKSAEEWAKHVVAVKGGSTFVENAIESYEVIYKYSFMNEMTAIVYLNGGSIQGEGLEFETVSLHDMLIYLSKQQKEGFYV